MTTSQPSPTGDAEAENTLAGLGEFGLIARLTEGPMVLVVNDQTSYKSLKEFVDDAKANPNKLIFSSSGRLSANSQCWISLTATPPIRTVPFSPKIVIEPSKFFG